MLPSVTLLLASISLACAIVLPRDDVKLAVKPACGDYSSSAVKDVRGTLPDLSTFSTIVTFGVSSFLRKWLRLRLYRMLILMEENMMDRR
jgi:hypothetical protein